MYLDSQPLTGVPADRHLTQSEPVETEQAARRRESELAQSSPTFVLDGLGPYNPRLAITDYPELREWLASYTEVGRVGQTIVYERIGGQMTGPALVYLPAQHAARLPRNAPMPSWASAARAFIDMTSFA